MPTPFTDFENSFRSAETLLKVYRLLDTPNGPQTEHALTHRVRELLMARDDEELILLTNELFMGVVRENADMRPAVFKHDNLNMLLRQAIVAGCSAIDVYYPALLREHLPQIIAVKERNFMPADKSTKDFLKGFQLSLEDSLRMLSEKEQSKYLGNLLSEYFKRQTFSTQQGVAVSLQILGVEDPWNKIAQCLGQPRESLAKQFEALVSRRNDIVHRGDRDSKDPTGAVQAIAYAWTEHHIRTARSVALASEQLVTEQISLLIAPEPKPAAVNNG